MDINWGYPPRNLAKKARSSLRKIKGHLEKLNPAITIVSSLIKYNGTAYKISRAVVFFILPPPAHPPTSAPAIPSKTHFQSPTTADLPALR